MEKISWKKEYEIGVPEIDPQHQFCVGIIQNISAAYANDCEKD